MLLVLCFLVLLWTHPRAAYLVFVFLCFLVLGRMAYALVIMYIIVLIIESLRR
jgi:hypothetical protein